MLIVLSILIVLSLLSKLIVISVLSMLIVHRQPIAAPLQRAQHALQAHDKLSKLSKLRGGGSMQSVEQSACNQGDNLRTACACVHR